jgi:hypothetical protein
MEITKNKNPKAMLKIFYIFLNPYPIGYGFFWKSQTFGKSLETFGLQIFFLRFWKSIGWYGCSFGLLVVLNLFHQINKKKLTKKSATKVEES